MFTAPSRQVMRAADRALAALEHLDIDDQLAAAGWATLSVLGALRARFEKRATDQHAFDRLCSETETWLRREIGALRFTRDH